jgi:flagellar basal-body rod modification protein FlgD
VVDTLPLGPRPAGDLSFAWDGKDAQGNAMPDGDYTFKVRATAGAVAISANSFSVAQVNGVALSSTGPLLDLSNGSSVALSAIRKIL